MSEDALYLQHILESIEKIERYVQVGHEEFMAASHWQDAVIRQLEIIGEAVKRLSPALTASRRDIPWSDIAGRPMAARIAPIPARPDDLWLAGYQLTQRWSRAVQSSAMTDLWEIAVKIGLSALLAGAIGAEREWVGKWAGLRTHMLIAVGAALLTHVSVLIGEVYAGGSNAWDPGRIAAQIVSGVGFLGAGTIIQARGAVHGLTTAAGLWVASALGIAVGAGFYGEAALTTIALLLILVALRPVEKRLFHGDRQMVIFELREGRRPSDLLALLEAAPVEVEEVSLDPRSDPGTVTVRLRGSGAEIERVAARAAEDGIAEGERKRHHSALPH